MSLGASHRLVKSLLRALSVAYLLECACLLLLRPTRGLELLQSCGECCCYRYHFLLRACSCWMASLLAHATRQRGRTLMTRRLRDHTTPRRGHRTPRPAAWPRAV
ncbi:hypothetical protein TRVL_10210 [Trypanosoma vivax]|nr:hypothetical protein TRVL_10210 [Trypanosoma vivax]